MRFKHAFFGGPAAEATGAGGRGEAFEYYIIYFLLYYIILFCFMILLCI